MDIFLDNIIFSLQRSGGASVVWKQHLDRLLKDKKFDCNFLEYDNANLNYFRQQLSINSEQIDLKSSHFLALERYLNLKSKNNNKHIFHSSHYRVESGKNAMNVTTVHDFTYEYFIKGLKQKVHSWQKNIAINNSNGIICVSENTKKDLIRFLPGINKNKINVIHNGVDESFKLLEYDFVFERKHLFDDYCYALYVGDRNAFYKNFDLAVNACVLAKRPLLIIGGGELIESEIHNLKSKLGAGNFKSLLSVSVEHLNYYYNRAFCLLYPSLYEGFGIPVVEAQAAGCPVIATNSSSIPEVIGNDYLAIYNPTPKKIADKMKELSTNNLRKETIEQGFEKSKQFSWQNTYNKTSDFYKELYFEK
jgi:glycosyltransferase involved in cell wall biosynthesis